MISRESIDEVLLRTDIQSLISGYVSLKRAGSNLKGLCPFHSEKSPSFTVYPANNSFYCFGCGAGGDQVSFIMRAEHLDYPDAIEFLAKRAGVTLVETDTGAGIKSTPKVDKARFLQMNVDAAKYYHAYLFNDNPAAKNALSYFTDKRKLSLSTIKHFGLGFAPDSYDQFTKYMLGRGYTRDELVQANLCRRNENGRVYDAFRNRVMFPVIDVAGNVIAFGGRVMDDSKPKYLNTTDTPVFKKSRNLFALNFARHNCKESIILCEGYMDVIALHAVGITNAVATLGTAITSEQARMLGNYSRRVIISYDADEAGRKATERAIKLLEDVGIEVSVLSIPGAKDPDEYIKTYGVEKFKEVIGVAKSKFDYAIESVLGKYDIALPQDKINALEEVEKLISKVYSAAEREVYMHAIAKRFGVNYESIKLDVDRIIAKNRVAARREESKRVHEVSVGYGDRINPDFIKAPAVARNEEYILGLMLLYPEHRKRVVTEKLLCQDDFFTELNRRIFTFICEAVASGDDTLSSVGERFNLDETGRIQKIKVARMQFGSASDSELLEAIDALRRSVKKKTVEATDSIEALTELLRAKDNV